MKIAVDMDDTLVDTESAIYPVICEYFNLDYKSIMSDSSFDYYSIRALKGYDEWTRKNWCKYAVLGKPKDHAVEVLNYFYDKGYDITILTARNTLEFDDPTKRTIEQLDKYGFKYTRVVGNVSLKAKYCKDNNIDIIIDDSKKKCIDVEEPTIVIMPITRINKLYEGKAVRANSWLQIKDIVEKIEKRKK